MKVERKKEHTLFFFINNIKFLFNRSINPIMVLASLYKIYSNLSLLTGLIFRSKPYGYVKGSDWGFRYHLQLACPYECDGNDMGMPNIRTRT